MSENANSVNMLPSGRGYHHGDLREALLTCGLDLLKSRSSESFSLREIARQVGVSATAVYRHFPDKAALLKALCARGALELADAQAKAMVAAGGGHRGFVATGGAYIRFALANPALFRVMMANMPPGGFFSADFSGDQVGMQMLRDNIRQIVSDAASEDGVRFGMLMAWAQVHGLAMLMLEGLVPASEADIEAFESSRLEFRFVPPQPSE